MTDRQIIVEHLSALQVQTFYTPPSGGYVGCIDTRGRIVLTLYPGYVVFMREVAPANLPEPDWPGLTLSTFRPHDSPAATPMESARVCPIHNIVLVLTGICDECP